MNVSLIGNDVSASIFTQALEQAGIRIIDNAPAVVLCLPAHERSEAVRSSALEGRQIIVPLPFAFSLQEAEELVSFCAQKKAVLIPALYGQYFGNIADLRMHMKKRTVGSPGVVNWKRYCPLPSGGFSAQNAAPSRSAFEGLLPELATVLSIFDPVYSAHYAERHADAADYSVLTLKTFDGVLLQIEALYGSVLCPYTEYEVSGTEGNICFDSRKAESVRFDGAIDNSRGTMDVSLCSSAVNPYRLMFEDIRERLKAKTTDELLNNSLSAYRALDAAFKTAGKGGTRV